MIKNQNSAEDVRQLVSKLDRNCRHVFSMAADLAYGKRHVALDAEHVLFVFLDINDDPVIRRSVANGFDVSMAKTAVSGLLSLYQTDKALPPAMSDQIVDVLRSTWLSVSLESQNGLIDIHSFVRNIMAHEAIFKRLSSAFPSIAILQKAFEISSENEPHTDKYLRINPLHSNLARFTVDLTERAKAGEIDPVIGRESEISQVVEILLRRRQNNPILTGDAGVGKTAIIEGLAMRVASGLVPKGLLDVRICSLDMGLLRAGASMRGEIEARIKGIIAEIATSDQPVILFIDEAHTLVAGAGSQGEQGDIANLIKPELARGSLRTIAATTWAEYKRYFEKDAALSRRFQNVQVAEPTLNVTEDILQALVPSLQKHHGVYILQSAVKSAVQLSSRYIQGRQLPDKAISVLDTACARAVASLTGPANEHLSLSRRKDLLTARLDALQMEFSLGLSTIDEVELVKKSLMDAQTILAGVVESVRNDISQKTDLYQPRVGDEEVASVIADWSGVPSQKMLLDQRLLAVHLEVAMAKRVVGQKHALSMISDGVRSYAANLGDPSKPIGVYMLAGPSGTGKTETAHALAEAFFGNSCMTVVNMSEYQESHTVSKLKGAPAGYIGYGQGGVLTEAVRRQPYGILLLDEVEKAHPDVLNLFLQVFDKGFMEDSEGVSVDFKNILILMTSNAGSDFLESIGSFKDRSIEEITPITEELRARLSKLFQPAILGRAQIVPYFPLEKDDIRSIVQMKLDSIKRRFDCTHAATLVFDSQVFERVVELCASSEIGARWIDQFISENILNRLSIYVLEKMASRTKIGSVRFSLLNGNFSCSDELYELT
jgi:type VI secretion system protein VasG